MSVLAMLGLVAIAFVVLVARARKSEGRSTIVDSRLPPLQTAPPRTNAQPMPFVVTDSMTALVKHKGDLKFLHAQWAAAERERAAGNLTCVPHWFFDEATDAQRERLLLDGWDRPVATTACKGMASDLIGLALAPDADQRAFLRRHQVSTRNMSQSRARYEIADLEADPDRAARLRVR